MLISTNEKGFRNSEKNTWFDEKEYINFLGINPGDNYIYPSEIYDNLENDKIVTLSFKAAIEINTEIFLDKIVLDINSGIGLNSLFACKFGASKVYSIEPNKTKSKLAKKISRDNYYDNVIININCNIYELKIKEKVDIIICNWMGNFLLQNSYIKQVIYARNNILTKNGLIFPNKAILYICAIEDNEYKSQKLDSWDNIYGIDMNCIEVESIKSPLIESFNQKSIISSICPIFSVDLYNIKERDINFSSSYELTFIKKDYCSAFACWFDVEFSHLPNQIKFTTGPFNSSTKWNQTIFYIPENYFVNKGDKVYGSICCTENIKMDELSGLNIKLSFNFERKINEKGEIKINKGIQLYKINS